MYKSTALKMEFKWMETELGPNCFILFTLFHKSCRRVSGTSAMLDVSSILLNWMHHFMKWIFTKISKNKEMWIIYVLNHNIRLILRLTLFLHTLLNWILSLWSNTCQSVTWHKNYSSKRAYVLSPSNFCLSLKFSHHPAYMHLLGIACNNYTSIFELKNKAIQVRILSVGALHSPQKNIRSRYKMAGNKGDKMFQLS